MRVSKPIWTTEELETLKNLCQSCRSTKEVREKAKGVFPKRSWNGIRFQIVEHPEWAKHFFQESTISWTPEELEALKNLCQSCRSKEEVREKSKGVFPKRSWNGIRVKIREHPEWVEHFSKDPKERSQTIKERIKLLEEGRITPQEFLSHLSSKLKTYWDVIFHLLEEHRLIRNTLLVEHLHLKGKFSRYQKLNISRGILGKFSEWGLLAPIKFDEYNVYFCALPGFYSVEELMKLVPQELQRNILKVFDNKTLKAEELSGTFQMNRMFLEEILDAFVQNKILEKSKKGYHLAAALREMGVSLESIKALGLIQAQNIYLQEEEKRAAGHTPANLKEIEESVRKDLEHKLIKPLILNVKEDPLKIAFIGEVRLGQQYADIELLNWAMKQIRSKNPHLIIVSDLVQGDFRGIQVERLRSLTRTGFLSRIEVQHKAANLVLNELETIAKNKVIYQLSDDDWQVAVSRAIIALTQYRGIRRSGLSSLLPEEVKRLSGADYYRFMKIQWEIVQPYMYRIGRSLLNADEVEEIIGDHHSEILLITFILLFEQFKQPIPEKYKKIVDIEALHADKAGSKRMVTPDPLIVELPEFGNRYIQAVHNIAFSDITQYYDSLLIPERIERHLQLRGEKRPFLLVDFHQERFFGAKINDTYVFNLPGCQNPVLGAANRIKTFHSKVLGDKAHRQNTFRKEPVTPAIPYFEIFKDGRIRFKLWTRRVKEIIEANNGKPEVKETTAHFQDLQLGSITMRPEWVIKAHDYALWTRAATHVDYNGDIIQGFHYPQFPSENRPKRLVSVKSQKSFTESLILPFYPAPNVKVVDIRLGNHEWKIWGSDITGQNNLEFLEIALRNKLTALGEKVEVAMWSRIRMVNSSQPGGATLNWPYTARKLDSGFKYGIQHIWYPKGGGRTPIHTQITWAVNMAGSARDLDVMIGGDRHSFWTALIDDKLMLQLPGLLDQSGFEMARGLMPQSLFCLVEFSTKEGITVELIPIEFLEKYQCISPRYKNLNEVLKRPEPGTREYRFGLDSPYIHQLEEEIDSIYSEV